MTSSPGPQHVNTACVTLCFAPFEITISFGLYSTPFSRFNFSHIAVRNGNVPGFGEYFVFPHSIALMPAFAHTSGVSKSGSPAAKPMTSSPRSFSVLAKSVRATVFDSFRSRTRGFKLRSTPDALGAFSAASPDCDLFFTTKTTPTRGRRERKIRRPFRGILVVALIKVVVFISFSFLRRGCCCACAVVFLRRMTAKMWHFLSSKDGDHHASIGSREGEAPSKTL